MNGKVLLFRLQILRCDGDGENLIGIRRDGDNFMIEIMFSCNTFDVSQTKLLVGSVTASR